MVVYLKEKCSETFNLGSRHRFAVCKNIDIGKCENGTGRKVYLRFFCEPVPFGCNGYSARVLRFVCITIGGMMESVKGAWRSKRILIVEVNFQILIGMCAKAHRGHKYEKQRK